MQQKYEKEFNKDLVKGFANIYEFCDEDVNKFILLLKKEFIHMNTWTVGKGLMKYYRLI